MSHRRLITPDTELCAALMAVCDATPHVACDPVSLRCSFNFSFAADDAPACIEDAATQFQNGSLEVNARALQRAQHALRDLIREAKRSASQDESPAALEQRAIAFRREHPHESNNPFATRLRQLVDLEAERGEWRARVDAVGRAQLRGRPATPQNGGDASESEG